MTGEALAAARAVVQAVVMDDHPDGEARRIDGDDGQAYTFSQFEEYYGSEEALSRWEQAAGHMPEDPLNASPPESLNTTREVSSSSHRYVRHKRKKSSSEHHQRRQTQQAATKQSLKRKLLRAVAKSKIPVIHQPKTVSTVWAPDSERFDGLHVVPRSRLIGFAGSGAQSDDLHTLVANVLGELLARDAFKPTFIVRELTAKKMVQRAVHPRRLVVGRRGLTHGSKSHRLFAASWDSPEEVSSGTASISNDTPHATLFAVLNRLRQALELNAASLKPPARTGGTDQFADAGGDRIHSPASATCSHVGRDDGGGGGDGQGSSNADFLSCNEVLINYYPNGTAADRLPNDKYCDLPGCAMTWHRDKGLAPKSNVIVYSHNPDNSRSRSMMMRRLSESDGGSAPAFADNQCTRAPPPPHHPTGKAKAAAAAAAETVAPGDEEKDWRVGFKVAWDAATPVITCPVADGDAYFMRGSFNDTHQHAVFAGSGYVRPSHRRRTLTDCVLS